MLRQTQAQRIKAIPIKHEPPLWECEELSTVRIALGHTWAHTRKSLLTSRGNVPWNRGSTTDLFCGFPTCCVCVCARISWKFYSLTCWEADSTQRFWSRSQSKSSISQLPARSCHNPKRRESSTLSGASSFRPQTRNSCDEPTLPAMQRAQIGIIFEKISTAPLDKHYCCCLKQ